MPITTVQGQMLTAPLTLTGNLTFSDSSVQTAAASPYVLKNRIINGDMRIAQRGTAALSISTDPSPRNYPIDRFFCSASGGGVYSAQQSFTAPAGFVNSLINTVTTADSSIAAGDVYYMSQAIEGYNIADLAWGTANAKTVTLSFWVYSSLTGTFSGAIRNGAASRSYCFNYTISASNTWTQISVTVTGDTTGTWATDNSAGIYVAWDLGSGTNFNGTASAWNAGNYLRTSSAINWISTLGATLYITGVQLEIGTSATPFERRLYNQELANCQRYYQLIDSTIWNTGNNTGFAASPISFKTEMRTAPSIGQTAVITLDVPYVGTTAQSSTNISIGNSGAWATTRGIYAQCSNFSGLRTYSNYPQAVNGTCVTLSAEL